MVFAANRRLAEAHALLVLWCRETPEHPWSLGLMSWLSALESRKAESAAPLAKVLANEEFRGGMRADSMGVSLFDPWLENVRGDPRFEVLMVPVKREWESFEV